jgi:hypothetical protein
LAAELESRITPQDKAEWQKGSIEDWVMEGHRLAQRVAYGDLSNENPAPITAAYERQADPVIELQLEKAGVRLAYLLDANLMPNAAADLKTASLRVEPLGLMVIVGNQGGLTPVGVKAHGVAGVPQRKAERSAVAAGKLLAGKK